jgi:hypothetical protein
MLRTLSSSTTASHESSTAWVSDKLRGYPFPVKALGKAISAHEGGRELFANLAFTEQVLTRPGCTGLAGVPVEVLSRAADEVRMLNSFYDQTQLQLFELQLREQIAQKHGCSSTEDYLIPAPYFGRRGVEVGCGLSNPSGAQ